MNSNTRSTLSQNLWRICPFLTFRAAFQFISYLSKVQTSHKSDVFNALLAPEVQCQCQLEGLMITIKGQGKRVTPSNTDQKPLTVSRRVVELEMFLFLNALAVHPPFFARWAVCWKGCLCCFGTRALHAALHWFTYVLLSLFFMPKSSLLPGFASIFCVFLTVTSAFFMLTWHFSKLS